jgi:hypothetical protein
MLASIAFVDGGEVTPMIRSANPLSSKPVLCRGCRL